MLFAETSASVPPLDLTVLDSLPLFLHPPPWAPFATKGMPAASCLHVCFFLAAKTTLLFSFLFVLTRHVPPSFSPPIALSPSTQALPDELLPPQTLPVPPLALLPSSDSLVCPKQTERTGSLALSLHLILVLFLRQINPAPPIRSLLALRTYRTPTNLSGDAFLPAISCLDC